jgi:hypothetical protein
MESTNAKSSVSKSGDRDQIFILVPVRPVFPVEILVLTLCSLCEIPWFQRRPSIFN